LNLDPRRRRREAFGEREAAGDGEQRGKQGAACQPATTR